MTQGHQPIRERADCVRALGGSHIEGWDEASPAQVLADLGLARPALPDESETAIWSFESRPRANRLRRVRSYRWRN